METPKYSEKGTRAPLGLFSNAPKSLQCLSQACRAGSRGMAGWSIKPFKTPISKSKLEKCSEGRPQPSLVSNASQEDKTHAILSVEIAWPNNGLFIHLLRFPEVFIGPRLSSALKTKEQCKCSWTLLQNLSLGGSGEFSSPSRASAQYKTKCTTSHPKVPVNLPTPLKQSTLFKKQSVKSLATQQLHGLKSLSMQVSNTFNRGSAECSALPGKGGKIRKWVTQLSK